MEIKEETVKILENVRRVNESYDEVIKRLFLGEDAQTGTTFRIFVSEDAYEKAREESYRTRMPIGTLLSKIISEELNNVNKKEAIPALKSGDVVGTVPEEIQKQLIKLDTTRYEAWRKLEATTTEESKLWEQMKRDLKLSDKFQYNINNVATGALKRLHALESAISEICDRDQEQKIIKIMKELKEKTEGGTEIE